MTDAGESVDWQELHEFTDVDLLQSFVLAWRVERKALFIDVDLSLLPQHPFYEKPRPAQNVCIRPALIEFPHCERLESGGRRGAPVELVAELGHGAITGLRRPAAGRYEIRGDFGSVTVDAESPILRFEA